LCRLFHAPPSTSCIDHEWTTANAQSDRGRWPGTVTLRNCFANFVALGIRWTPGITQMIQPRDTAPPSVGQSSVSVPHALRLSATVMQEQVR